MGSTKEVRDVSVGVCSILDDSLSQGSSNSGKRQIAERDQFERVHRLTRQAKAILHDHEGISKAPFLLGRKTQIQADNYDILVLFWYLGCEAVDLAEEIIRRRQRLNKWTVLVTITAPSFVGAVEEPILHAIDKTYLLRIIDAGRVHETMEELVDLVSTQATPAGAF